MGAFLSEDTECVANIFFPARSNSEIRPYNGGLGDSFQPNLPAPNLPAPRQTLAVTIIWAARIKTDIGKISGKGGTAIRSRGERRTVSCAIPIERP